MTLHSATSILKLLADETRLRLLMLLRKQKLCVCELTSIMNESQPKISQHLAKLRDKNLITDKREGQFIYYEFANNPMMKDILDLLTDNLKNDSTITEDLNNSLNIKTILHHNSNCKK